MAKRLPVHNLDPAAGTDGQGIVITGGKFTIDDLPGSSPSVALVPLTTVVGGVPSLVWDDDNQLVMTQEGT